MAEYINRDELLAQYTGNILTAKIDCAEEMRDVIQDIKDAPVADVVPVVHGEWKWDTGDIYHCTNCNKKAHVKEIMNRSVWDYCPYCGAKMIRNGDNRIKMDWINVKFSTPESYTYVLCHLVVDKPIVREGFMCGNGRWYCNENFRKPGEVTHWAKMPTFPGDDEK